MKDLIWGPFFLGIVHKIIWGALANVEGTRQKCLNKNGVRTDSRQGDTALCATVESCYCVFRFVFAKTLPVQAVSRTAQGRTQAFLLVNVNVKYNQQEQPT